MISCIYQHFSTHLYTQEEVVPTSQESPVYWGGQEHCSTLFPGPPVPCWLVSSRPTSPRLSRWVWVKYRAWILSPTKSARTIISSSLETGLLLIAWRQFPCRSQLHVYMYSYVGRLWRKQFKILKGFLHLQELNSALVQPIRKGDLGSHVDQGHILTLGADETLNELSFC